LGQRHQSPVPARRLHRIAHAVIVTADPVAQRLAFDAAERVAFHRPLAVPLAQPVSVTPGTSAAHTLVMLVMNEPDSPFLDSVERRRPGTSLRGYVTRTLPHSSATVVANRAPHEPRPEGGFRRRPGGVRQARLT